MTNRIIQIARQLTITSLLVPLTGCGAAPNEDDALEFGNVESALSKNCAPEVDASIAAPEGNKLAFRLDATGDQVYICQASGNAYAWALQAPDAKLYSTRGKEVGTHYAGPTWEYKDGSSVVGTKLASFTPDTTAIPWLLIQATAHSGSGKMDDITYIQRLETVGGLAPDVSTCTAANLGGLAPVEYSAAYYFFVSGKPPCGCK